jgi:hypothetical protein
MKKRQGKPKKNRIRLTIYVDEKLHDAFVIEADQEYRSLSDHMNAILFEHFGVIDLDMLLEATQ